jgi:SAM-dependent methyltransferase
MTKYTTSDAETANLAHWEEMVEVHVQGGAYCKLPDFRAGEAILDPLVTSEIGDVRGKKILHLQCHFGLDTLSLARLGAEVTGIDFSPAGIAAAQALSAETGVPGRFIRCKVEEVPQHLNETFDMVFTSWGAIIWLANLTTWGQVIAGLLAPGGTFYMAEGHPLALALDEDAPSPHPGSLLLRHSCLSPREPARWETATDYADETTRLENKTTFEWNHDLGTVVTALSAAGLRIDYLREHPFIAWRAFPDLVERDDYFFELPDGFPAIPLSFSLRAEKPD